MKNTWPSNLVEPLTRFYTSYTRRGVKYFRKQAFKFLGRFNLALQFSQPRLKLNEKRDEEGKEERERSANRSRPLFLFRRARVLRDQARNAEILQQYLGRVVELFIGESLFDPRLSRSVDNRIGFNSSTRGGEDVPYNRYAGNRRLLLLEYY